MTGFTGGGGDIILIVGNGGDDLMIAGFTAFDANDAALSAIMAEWTSARSYLDRVKNLNGSGSGTRANGNIVLIADGVSATVFDDGVADLLTGSAGPDGFLFNVDGDGDASCRAA